ENTDFQSECASCHLRFFQRSFDIRGIRWIDKHGDTSCRRYQLSQDFQPHCGYFTGEKIDTCQVAAWPATTGDQTKPNGIVGDGEDNRDCCRCLLRCQCRSEPSG